MPRMARWAVWRIVAPAAALCAIWVILQIFGGPERWGYERQAIGEGELWRLLTGNLVHLNARHLALNLIILTGVMTVWGRELARPATFFGLFMASALAVGIGLWTADEGLAWYVGASGALHGLFAAGIVLASGADPLFRAAAALGLLFKLALETQVDIGTSGLIGAPVIPAAHEWGSAGGCLAALLWKAAGRLRGA